MQIGSAISSKGPLYAWEFGFGANDASFNAGVVEVDIAIGQAGAKKIIIPNSPVITTAAEIVSKRRADVFAVGAASELVYARAQTSTSSDTCSIAVYGIGG